MSRRMRSFVMRRIGAFAFMDTPPLTDPGPTGAIVRTTHALIGASGTRTVSGAIGDRETLTLGHEAVGISAVRGHEEGDRLAVDATTPDFTCPHGRLARLMGLLEAGRVDPTPMTPRRFAFDPIDRAFEIMRTKADGVIKPQIGSGA